MVAEFSEKLVLVQVSVLVAISLFDELQNIVVTDVNVQVLIENTLDIVKPNKTPLFPVEKGKQVEGFFLPTATEKPFFGNHVNDFAQGESFFIFILVRDFVLDLLSVHFGKCKIAQNWS